ncbi:hypothetical protein, partial [Nocardioides sp.]|uniref:hypothetical protein n=1 Tax=Nocardioides sp. TaxID=35761 RepID=UPI002736A83F
EQPEAEPEPLNEPEPEPEPEDAGLRTQAGLPIFDDESDDVSWLAARETPAPPPPPFEEPPQRPLFAPTPPRGEPARRSRPGSATTNGGSEYWPWADTGTGTGHGRAATGSGLIPAIDDEPPPGRSWLRLAAAIAAGLLLLVAIVVAYNLGRGKTVLGAEVDDDPTPTPTASTSAAARPTPLDGLKADDLDPQGGDQEENGEDAPLAVDGDPETSWSTSSYKQQLGPGGLKNGVGLSIDLNGLKSVTAVELTLVGAPTDISLYLADSSPSDLQGLEPVASATADKEKVTLELPEPTEGRFLVVWLTSLPPEGAEFRGTVAEVAVLGE